MKRSKYKSTILMLVILLFIVTILGIFAGRFYISPERVFFIIWDSIRGIESQEIESSILIELRFPRVCMNIIIGAGLAVAGTALQGIFQNPLVSPDIISVSSGSAFGAALGILLFGMNEVTIFCSMIFGVIGVIITYIFSKIRGESSTLSLILSGMVMSSLFGSLLSLIKYTADPYDKLPAITYWLMGSFSSSSYETLRISFLLIGIGIVILYKLRWRINILSLGDDEAKVLGINPKYSRVLIIMTVTLIVATCVTMTGVISWVGLLIPHVCRMIVGVDNTKLIPTSVIVGSIFMLIIDGIARTIISVEIPIGILSSLLGAPFFMLAFKKYQSW